MVKRLGIAGFESTGILAFYPASGHAVIYIPGDQMPLQEFKNAEEMKKWLMARLLIEAKPKTHPDWQEAQGIIDKIEGFYSKKLDGSSEYLDNNHQIPEFQAPLLSHFSIKSRLDGLDQWVADMDVSAASTMALDPLSLEALGLLSVPERDESLSAKMTHFIFSIELLPLDTTQSIAEQLVSRNQSRYVQDGKNAIVSNSDVHKRAAM